MNDSVCLCFIFVKKSITKALVHSRGDSSKHKTTDNLPVDTHLSHTHIHYTHNTHKWAF